MKTDGKFEPGILESDIFLSKRYGYPLKKTICTLIAALTALTIISVSDSIAADMRKVNTDLETSRSELKAKAEKELEAARIEARKRAEAIRGDRKSLKEAVLKLQKDNSELKNSNSTLETEIASIKEREKEVSESFQKSSAVNSELAGLIRSSAKDLDTLLVQSPQSALIKHELKDGDSKNDGDTREDGEVKGDGAQESGGENGNDETAGDSPGSSFLRPLINQEKFPSMGDIRRMVSELFQEISLSGEVRVVDGEIVDRQGTQREADILVLGNFTAAYRLKEIKNSTSGGSEGTAGETGFLIYSDRSQRFFALSSLPEKSVRENLKEYMDGKSDSVYMDISKGAALRELSHRLNLWQQIPKGGPVVWPILAILVVAFIILLERILFFFRKRMNADSFMKQIEDLVLRGSWKECIVLMERMSGKLIPKVLLTAVEFREMDRSDMENALQEAILSEIPRIERFLSTLGMLAAIAPLLGLLGTVTGMINVFHTITFYGTGDPRMMSGGISEALVTTMLGLVVAIPIMLVHTLLSRRVEIEIGKLEEKAVSFVNIVFRSRNGVLNGVLK